MKWIFKNKMWIVGGLAILSSCTYSNISFAFFPPVVVTPATPAPVVSAPVIVAPAPVSSVSVPPVDPGLIIISPTPPSTPPVTNVPEPTSLMGSLIGLGFLVVLLRKKGHAVKNNELALSAQ